MEAQLAFVRPQDRPGLEIRVNFGIFTGRAATPAEIDQLAAALVPVVGEVTIVNEERHEIDSQAEASVRQVRIEVAEDQIEGDPGVLQAQLCDLAERWAEACIADRHEDVLEL